MWNYLVYDRLRLFGALQYFISSLWKSLVNSSSLEVTLVKHRQRVNTLHSDVH